MPSLVNSSKKTKEAIILLLYKFFQGIGKKETIPSTFYEARITLITKPHKDITRNGI